jgi:hypothetical protein
LPGEAGTPATALGGEPGTEVGDPTVDALLARLERAGTQVFTASYRVTRKLGPVETSARVVQLPPQRAVTIGDVRFLVLGGGTQTCRVSDRVCEEGTLEQRASDTGVTSVFFADAPARALRVAWSRRAGEVTASQRTIAGAPVDCVNIPLAGPTAQGVEVYCVTDLGPVALWDAGDKKVELTVLEPAADPAELAPLNP